MLPDGTGRIEPLGYYYVPDLPHSSPSPHPAGRPPPPGVSRQPVSGWGTSAHFRMLAT